MKYKNYFKEIENYLLNKYKVKVILTYGSDDYWFPKLGKILIEKNNPWRERYFSLLHEAGHVCIDYDDIDFKIVNISQYKEKIKTKKDFVHSINEELMAWNLGENISINLGHTIDIEKFREIKTKCIMSYVKHGLNEVYGKRINISVIKS